MAASKTKAVPNIPVRVTLDFPSSDLLFTICRRSWRDTAPSKAELRTLIRESMLANFKLYAPHGKSVSVKVHFPKS